MTEHRPELILIAAYDLCHPNWSGGVIQQQIWRDHKIKVIKMVFRDPPTKKERILAVECS